MNRRALHVLTMALCLMLCVCAWPNAAHAFDPVDLDHPLTLTIFANDEEMPLGGVNFELYKVADMNQLAQFELLAAYAGFTGDINKLENAEQWQNAANYMQPIATAGVPDKAGETAADGFLTFDGLTPGLYLMTGEKVMVDPWYYSFSPVLVSIPTRDMDDEWIYDVFSDIKLEKTPAYIDIPVVKVWEDNGKVSRRPHYLYADLFCDGKRIKTATLKPSNGWSHTFEHLPAEHVYTVKERTIPNGYKVTYETVNGVMVIKNTLPEKPTPVPGLPATGQLWWPVPLLAASGMILFVIGWITHRKWSQEHE